jgi:hypothetical protein
MGSGLGFQSLPLQAGHFMLVYSAAFLNPRVQGHVTVMVGMLLLYALFAPAGRKHAHPVRELRSSQAWPEFPPAVAA